MPSGTDDSISHGKWAAGPSAVALKIDRHWVYGALANYLSSFAGQSDRGAVSQWLIQPFVNYNMPDGWYLVSGPIITANMMADSSQRWTVPLGGGAGRIIRVGQLPLNISLQGFYNVETSGCRTRLEHPVYGPGPSAEIISLGRAGVKGGGRLLSLELGECYPNNCKED